MKRNSGPKTGLNGDVDSDEGGGGGGGGGMKGVAPAAAACAHNPTCGSGSSGFSGKDTEVENVAGAAARVALCSHS